MPKENGQVPKARFSDWNSNSKFVSGTFAIGKSEVVSKQNSDEHKKERKKKTDNKNVKWTKSAFSKKNWTEVWL